MSRMQGATARNWSGLKLFVSRESARLSCRQTQRDFKKWLKEAGIEGEFTPHTLRHTAATNLLRRTGNAKLGQRYLGHSDVATTLRFYVDVFPEDLKRAAELLSEKKKRGIMRKLKLYIETSVWNFFFADDAPEKRDITRQFFASIEEGLYEIYISEVIVEEINNAPEPKKTTLFDLVNKYNPAELNTTQEASELAELYMERSIIPQNKRDDGLHVAIATVFEMDAVISWNYRHLASLRKSELFNSANLESGYTKRLEIVTPMEVSKDED